METSPNRYYRTCELNAVASYKDGKTILSDKFYTQQIGRASCRERV